MSSITFGVTIGFCGRIPLVIWLTVAASVGLIPGESPVIFVLFIAIVPELIDAKVAHPVASNAPSR